MVLQGVWVLSDSSNIYVATPEDISQIVTLGYASYKENILDTYSCTPDFEKIVVFITDLVLGGGLVLVLKEDDKVNGVLCFRKDSLWWSLDEVLYEALFYIKPEHRSFKNAKNLLNIAKKYGIITETPIVLDLFTQKDVDKKKRLLKYLGFKECGSFFVFEPKVDNKQQQEKESEPE